MKLFANARMYAVNAPTKVAWKHIFDWVFARADLDIRQIDHDPPKLLSNLWSRDDLGAVMMCGLPLIQRVVRPRILAQCVPSLPCYAGKATYCTDIVVAADSPFRSLADTFGHRAGYTLKDSQSGYYAFRHHLLTRHPSTRELYASITGGLMNARGIIRAIAEQRIDVGPLDGYVHDLIRHTEPDFAKHVRIIERTEPTPMPAIVATAPLDGGAVGRLQAAFAAAIDAAELSADRVQVLLSRFEFPSADVFDTLEERARLVDSAPTWP